MTETRKAIMKTLTQLSAIYPDMRFGQLVGNVAFWARGPEFEGAWDVSDPLFLEAARRHFERRCQQLEITSASVADSVSLPRAEVFRAMENLGERYPERPLTELVAQVADWAGATVYDIEDELLVEKAKDYLSGPPHSKTPDTALS